MKKKKKEGARNRRQRKQHLLCPNKMQTHEEKPAALFQRVQHSLVLTVWEKHNHKAYHCSACNTYAMAFYNTL